MCPYLTAWQTAVDHEAALKASGAHVDDLRDAHREVMMAYAEWYWKSPTATAERARRRSL